MFQEVTISPASTISLSLDLNEGSSWLKILRMQQVMDGARVMGHREIEILILFILQLKVAHQRD